MHNVSIKIKGGVQMLRVMCCRMQIERAVPALAFDCTYMRLDGFRC